MFCKRLKIMLQSLICIIVTEFNIMVYRVITKFHSLKFKMHCLYTCFLHFRNELLWNIHFHHKSSKILTTAHLEGQLVYMSQGIQLMKSFELTKK